MLHVYCMVFLIAFLFTWTLCEIVVITKQRDKIYSGQVLFTVPLSMWSLCAQFCSRVQVCKSINFIVWNKTCQINDADPGGSKCGLIESTGTSFVSASALPKQLAGQCKGNDCKRNEACMPRGQDYYCAPLPITLPECSIQLRPRDCSDLPVGSDSGVYTIYPTNAIFDVYCDMDTAGFGWTVFQTRINGAKDFYRRWIDYDNGFGSLTSEFWLGNKFIHLLTSIGNYKLYINLEDFEGNSAYAEYLEFSLGDSATNYRLDVGGYCGTAGDSLKPHNGRMFSTKDKDNDIVQIGCAQTYKGAWWYGGCHSSNLNGECLGVNHSNYANGIIWDTWAGYYYSLKSTRMIKRHQ